VTDLAESLYRSAMPGLEATRTTYARYLQLLDAQRAALRADDLHLLSALALEGSGLLARLERETRIPPELGQHLHVSDGLRAGAVRGVMAAVRGEAEAAQAGVQEVTVQLELRRRSVLGALAELSGGGSPYHPPRLPPAELDATG